MTKNHELLGLMGVSSIQLDAMVDRALKAGAYGAKLVGAGKGGNVVALVDENRKERVMNELKPLSKDIRFAVVL
jgi:mevalonate kinase